MWSMYMHECLFAFIDHFRSIKNAIFTRRHLYDLHLLSHPSSVGTRHIQPAQSHPATPLSTFSLDYPRSARIRSWDYHYSCGPSFFQNFIKSFTGMKWILDLESELFLNSKPKWGQKMQRFGAPAWSTTLVPTSLYHASVLVWYFWTYIFTVRI